MSYLIALDPGHDISTAGKRTPTIPGLNIVIKENEFNEAVVNFLDAELKRCGFKTLNVAPEMGIDTPLKTRTDRANNAKADLLISVHFNAFDGKWESTAQGLSVHVYPGYPLTKAKAQIMLKWLLKGTPQVNRGVVESDFHMLRESHMDAILVENGFMDYIGEARLMASPGYRKEVAQEIAQATCEIFKVPYIGETQALKADYDKLLADFKAKEIQHQATNTNLQKALASISTLQGDLINMENEMQQLIEVEKQNVIKANARANVAEANLKDLEAEFRELQETHAESIAEKLGEINLLNARILELEKEIITAQEPPVIIDWKDASWKQLLKQAIMNWWKSE